MANQTKRFSLRYKLILIFSLLIITASTTEIIIAVRTARKAVTEKIEAHLIDKATDTAEVIDGKVTAFFQFFEGVARAPILRDPNVSYHEKTMYLSKEAAFNNKIHRMDLADMQGIRYTDDGHTLDTSQQKFFIVASQGKNFLSEPLVSRFDGFLVVVFAVPNLR